MPNFRFLFSQKAHPTLPEIFYFLTLKWREKLAGTQTDSTHEKHFPKPQFFYTFTHSKIRWS